MQEINVTWQSRPGIHWLGGAPCAGKSSVAEWICERTDFVHYKWDDHFDRQMRDSCSRGGYWAAQLEEATHEFVFMRSDAENLELMLGLHAELFPFVLKDLEKLDSPILVEGAVLQPDLLASAGVDAKYCAHLFAEEKFYREKYRERIWAWDRLQETSNPEQAYENWMIRDVAFAKKQAENTAALGYDFQWVNGEISIPETAFALAEKWGLHLK